MEILIPLPQSPSINTYKELKSYLKQLELAIHYAQKSVDNAEAMGVPISEDCFADFRHPGLQQEMQDEYYTGLQSVQLNININ